MVSNHEFFKNFEKKELFILLLSKRAVRSCSECDVRDFSINVEPRCELT